jgi:hypothetical protein
METVTALHECVSAWCTDAFAVEPLCARYSKSLLLSNRRYTMILEETLGMSAAGDMS